MYRQWNLQADYRQENRGRRRKIINRRHILKKRRDRLTTATQFHIVTILLWSVIICMHKRWKGYPIWLFMISIRLKWIITRGNNNKKIVHNCRELSLLACAPPQLTVSCANEKKKKRYLFLLLPLDPPCHRRRCIFITEPIESVVPIIIRVLFHLFIYSTE